ncbi:protein artemis [Diorhabda carinulata]|uniref:protein artemis n=1 Tax=Diorhabda carinulata TaxID=1163345 RepID=UPI0025A1056E|nr:protein artemis [Diorhabda carinulata]
MRTFSGKIQEIPNISVDRFVEENLKSEIFFLSHCHTDHMVGLDSYNFKSELMDNKKYLYASEISCTILKNMFPHYGDCLKMLPLNTPKIFQLKNSSFAVTLIPAGHCPGSVMFLFENDKKILYTGDYRVNINDIKKFAAFYNTYGSVKIMDKIYLDTTFFLKNYPSFPKRDESLEQLCDILKKWLEENASVFVHVKTSAKYGYEYVYKEIFKKIGMPVHVNKDVYKFYNLVPELDGTVTLDPTKTRIHGNCGTKLAYNCLSDEKLLEIKTVKLSAMMWNKNRNYEPKIGTHCICYSTHASYEEGVALINFLRPKDIEICVEHENVCINNEIRKLVQHHLLKIRNVEPSNQSVEPKSFNTGKREESLKKNINYEIFESSNSENSSNTTDLNVVKHNESQREEQFLGTVQNSDDDKNVLYKIMFGSPEITTNKVVDIIPDVSDEEDSVIYNIVNWSPNKKKKL